MAGAASLRVLGAAGLGAFAVMTALNKVMAGADRNARNIFGTGLGAAGAGTSIQRYTAISQALKISGNVPETDTQSWLTGFTQAQERYRLGDPSAAVALQTELARAGVDANALTGTPQGVLVAIARRFGQLSPQAAQAAGTGLGLSPALSEALRQSGGNLPKEIADQRRAITARDTQAARDLLKAQNDLSVSWGKLTRTIYDDLTPALSSWEGWLARIIDSITTISNPDASHKQKMDAYGGMPFITMEWWRRHLPTWLGGRSSAAGGGPEGGTGAGGASPTMKELVDLGIDKETAASLSAIARRESPNGNARNFRYQVTGHDANGVPTGYTASGYFQMLATNWHNYGQGIVDFSKYPEAIDAPLGLQAKVAAQMYKTNGYSPWDAAHGGSIAGDAAFARYRAEAMRSYSSAPSLTGTIPVATAYGIVNMTAAQYAEYTKNIGHLPDILSLSGRARQPLDVIKRAQAAAAASNVSNTNHNVEVSGGIHVHTAATTATGIAAAALMAGKGAGLLVNQANRGLE